MNMAFEYWFACISPLSNRKKHRLRGEYKEAEQIYYIEEKELLEKTYLGEKEVQIICASKKTWEIEERYRKLQKEGIWMTSYFSGEYPQKLKDIPDPPYALYIKGKLPAESRFCVAIVGARRCTPYGEQMAIQYGEQLAKAGMQIISGMAKGIDGAGQRGALNVNGDTYGILGCGPDVCYPREHIGLYMDIQQRGGIISEYPPGTPPLPAYFPERNRIISGISDVVLVMEAKEKSGSLITADIALEQGKNIYALPGPVTSALSRGCNNLIRQGADILLSPEELLFDMGISFVTKNKKSDKNKKILESNENIVYSRLGLYPRSISQLADETKLAPSELLEQLVSLELEGYVKEISKHYYIKVK